MIITRSAAVAEDVEKRKLGIVVESNVKSVVEAIHILLVDNSLQTEYKANITEFVRSRASGEDFEVLVARLI